MLPAILEKDETLKRPMFEIREVPAISLVHEEVGNNLPYVTEWPNDDKHITYFVIRSAYSKKLYDVLLPISVSKFIVRYSRWVHGEHIQDAFSMFDMDIREFIKTGITPSEWKLMFPEEPTDTKDED